MILLLVSLFTYAVFLIMILTAFIIHAKTYGERLTISQCLILVFWPLTVFRGLFHILDDNYLNVGEVVIVLFTIVFWGTTIAYLFL